MVRRRCRRELPCGFQRSQVPQYYALLVWRELRQLKSSLGVDAFVYSREWLNRCSVLVLLALAQRSDSQLGGGLHSVSASAMATGAMRTAEVDVRRYRKINFCEVFATDPSAGCFRSPGTLTFEAENGVVKRAVVRCTSRRFLALLSCYCWHQRVRTRVDESASEVCVRQSLQRRKAAIACRTAGRAHSQSSARCLR
jgi:hypothetical protein